MTDYYRDDRGGSQYEHLADTSSSLSCEYCGKQYLAVHHLDIHQRTTCLSAKRSICELLQRTREHWEAKKRQRTEAEEPYNGRPCDANVASTANARSPVDPSGATCMLRRISSPPVMEVPEAFPPQAPEDSTLTEVTPMTVGFLGV